MVIWAALVLAVVAAVPVAAVAPEVVPITMAVAAISPAVAATKQSESLFHKRKGLFSCIFGMKTVNTFHEESTQKWEVFHERLREKDDR